MVGIVIVSHSRRLAEGIVELAREMGGPDVRLEPVGGLALPGHPIGTDAVMVMEAIDRAWSDSGVLVLMDLGSAVLSAEMALDLLPDERRPLILLCEAPIVEGAVAAAVTAKLGAPLERVAQEARGGLAGKIAHLGTEPAATAVEPGPPGDVVSLRVTVGAVHGLHARPAARFVQTASGFDALVRISDLTNGRGPADAGSLNAVAVLGATQGHEIEVTASGPQASEAIAAIRALAERDFDDHPDAGEGAPTVAPSSASVPGGLAGHAASPGIAMGPARRFHVSDLKIPDSSHADPVGEAAALETALVATREDIERQRATVAARAGATQAEIFGAHLLFLGDTELLTPTRQAISEGLAAGRAWHDAVDRIAAAWDGLEDEYLRARAADLRSVGAQVLAHILGVPPPRPELEGPGVLIAADLSPADTAGLDPDVVLGIATVFGGPTSHAAVLARSLGIPAVVGVGASLMEVVEGTPLGLDGAGGMVYVQPSTETLASLQRLGAAHDAAARGALAAARDPAITADGTLIEVSANIGSTVDAARAVAAGADGVGLYRTEFLFMGRSSMPDEQEQEAAYRATAEALDGRPMLIRTLDVGADKPLPYLMQPAEANPFLGIRGIRLGLQRPDLLGSQLRAICRVATDHRVRVMFPMVADIRELRAARAILAQMDGSGAMEVGVMIEVPSAALLAERLAPEVDFFSIGTNDLTQYTLAADRGNDRVGALADALHPAVLRLIALTAEAAESHGRWVGVCGELAGDPEATPLLLGLGVKELSMSAPAIPLVKQAVRRTDLPDARALAARALSCATAPEVHALLADARPG